MLTPDQTDKVIVGVLDLAKVIIGAAIGSITTWLVSTKTAQRNERRKARKELGKLQFLIISENVANNYQIHLKKLKDFFADNFDLMGKYSVNQEFFREWLQHPFIGQQFVDPSWTTERIAQLKADVQKLVI